ncbi:MAG: hypothetical protein ACFE0O_15565 [Opitutales bacterium]
MIEIIVSEFIRDGTLVLEIDSDFDVGLSVVSLILNENIKEKQYGKKTGSQFVFPINDLQTIVESKVNIIIENENNFEYVGARFESFFLQPVDLSNVNFFNTAIQSPPNRLVRDSETLLHLTKLYYLHNRKSDKIYFAALVIHGFKLLERISHITPSDLRWFFKEAKKTIGRIGMSDDLGHLRWVSGIFNIGMHLSFISGQESFLDFANFNASIDVYARKFKDLSHYYLFSNVFLCIYYYFSSDFPKAKIYGVRAHDYLDTISKIRFTEYWDIYEVRFSSAAVLFCLKVISKIEGPGSGFCKNFKVPHVHEIRVSEAASVFFNVYQEGSEDAKKIFCKKLRDLNV